jgi:flavin reductase (DIM6/NTAB) family NADH-FMN oxidoreductase RutF
LNPLLVTVSIKRSSPLLGYVRSAEAFAVSVLASDQQQVAEYFAIRGRTPQPDGFATVPTTTRETARRSLMAASAGSTALSRTSCQGATMRFSSAAWPAPAVERASPWCIGPVDIAR